ncbi:MAG: hypothetical protein M1342_01560 [Patescibacteria group bacterium]|nr:hypothetical protein [Patescibacteria group bacterium]
MLATGDAKVLDETDGYTTLIWTGEASVTPFQIIMGVFPSSNKTLVADTFDMLPDSVRSKTGRSIDLLAHKAHAISLLYGMHPDRTYIYQHIAPQDDYHTRPHAASFKQIHFHILPDYPNSEYRQGQRLEVNTGGSALASKDMRRFIGERSFFMQLAREIIEAKYDGKVTYCPESQSFLFCSEPGLLFFSDDNTRAVHDLMVLWKKAWLTIGSCFTDFITDGNGRYLPVAKDVSMERLGQIGERFGLSDKSQAMLRSLGGLVKPADWTTELTYWDTFYKGIAGGLLFLYDYETNTSHAYASPRLSISADKTIIPPYADRIFRKDRSMGFNQDDAERIIQMKRAFIKSI